jgi:hypothetical protein
MLLNVMHNFLQKVEGVHITHIVNKNIPIFFTHELMDDLQAFFFIWSTPKLKFNFRLPILYAFIKRGDP